MSKHKFGPVSLANFGPCDFYKHEGVGLVVFGADNFLIAPPGELANLVMGEPTDITDEEDWAKLIGPLIAKVAPVSPEPPPGAPPPNESAK